MICSENTVPSFSNCISKTHQPSDTALHLEKNVFPTNIRGFKIVTACLVGSSATSAVATNMREEKEEEELEQT